MNHLEQMTAQMLACTTTQMLLRVAAAKLARRDLKVAVVGDCNRLSFMGEILTGDERVGLQLDYFAAEKSFYFKPYDELRLPDHQCFLVLDPDPARELKMCQTLLEQEAQNPSGPKLFVPWTRYTTVVQSVLRSVPPLPTCLNHEKLLAIAAGVCLSSDSGAIVECGVFQGGTTLFMGLLLKALGAARKIYGFDTFGGLPAPIGKDVETGYHYPAGFFSDTSLEGVTQLLTQHGLARGDTGIELVPGLVEHTLPAVLGALTPGFSLAFLDMDQYSGIFHALTALLKQRQGPALVFIDDVAIPGVDLAIREACAGHEVVRATVARHFDLLAL